MRATWNVDSSKNWTFSEDSAETFQHFKHLISNVLSTEEVADLVDLETENDGCTLSEIHYQYISKGYDNLTPHESLRMDERIAASTRGPERRHPEAFCPQSSSQNSEPSSTAIFLMAGAAFLTFFAFLLGRFN